ncbi:MAG: hypothetical protein MPK08_08045 [Alphaproteobacteria bacterium]|nr:hypothetical protein [Alphaproteobacteria bacterium]MDA8004819.1 hypothetical protein [Alphaproteobacteria bacterium]
MNKYQGEGGDDDEEGDEKGVGEGVGEVKVGEGEVKVGEDGEEGGAF